MPFVIHPGYATGPATGTEFISHTGTCPNTCTLPPPGNNPPSTPKQDDSQRSSNLPAQVTANHDQSTFGDFLHNYLQAVRELVTHTTPPSNPPSFIFEGTLQATQHNWNIIQMFNNLVNAIDNQAGTALTPGSEFKPVNLLQRVFARHPLWPHMLLALSVGDRFPLANLPSHL